MSDFDCPYCGAEQEVCHDDGFGLEEDQRHEMQCSKCEKFFVFDTCISVSHSAYRADCLNGKQHQLYVSSTYPRKYAKMLCRTCEFQRLLMPDEMAAHLAAHPD